MVRGALRAHGWEPIRVVLLGENVARYTRGVGVNADHAGVFCYLPVVFSDSFPWSFPARAGGGVWLSAIAAGAPDAIRDRVRTLLWLWILVIVGFFSLSAGKQDLYIFPIVPAVAALAGIAIARAGRRSDVPGAAACDGDRAIGRGAGIAGAAVVPVPRAGRRYACSTAPRRSA